MKMSLKLMSFLILAGALSFGVGVFVAEIKIRMATKPGKVLIYEAPKAEDKVLQTVGETNLEKAEEEAPTPENIPNPEEIKTEVETKVFSFAILGDTQGFTEGSSAGAFGQAVKNITKNNPNLVLATGDLISECNGAKKCEAKYNAWKAIMGSLLSKAYMVQGNHDRVEGNKADAVWQKVFNLPSNGPAGYSELSYSLDFENSHFVFLDSEKPEENIINGEQRGWLEKNLAANKKENTFVIFHEPAYPASSKIGESLDAKPGERNALWDILSRHKVTAVFSGHEHIASRKQVAGVYQFGFGNTDTFNHEMPRPGMAEYAYVGNHFAMVKVEGKKITINTHAVSGNLLNSFSFSK